jgi:multidrug efflux pump subunit AcrA (membrane-fusion protein)
MQPLVPLLLVALLLAACERLEPPPAPPPPEVTVANPLRQEIVDWDEFTGRIVATAEVEIRARVSGYLQSVEFTDGSLVTKGQPLYVIDPRPFRASLAQAQAEQRAAEARLKLAENDEARAERLFKTRNIPPGSGLCPGAGTNQRPDQSHPGDAGQPGQRQRPGVYLADHHRCAGPDSRVSDRR